MTDRPALAQRFRLGWRVLLALLALTALELPVAFRIPRPLPYLVAINLLDALLILEYFMHLSQMWHAEE